MKKRILSIMLAVALILSFGLVTAPVVAGGPLGNTVDSSTMYFEGELALDGDGHLIGTIPMTAGEYYTGGGFDIYGKEGAMAYCPWPEFEPPYLLPIVDHDAWPLWNPDIGIPYWENHSLELTTDHWYLRCTRGLSPMSGTLTWNGDRTGYAEETDFGTVEGGEAVEADIIAHGAGPQAWDMAPGGTAEVIPLEYPGFDVSVSEVSAGVYAVTLTPAPSTAPEMEAIYPLSPVTDATYNTLSGTVDLVFDFADADGDLRDLMIDWCFAPYTQERKAQTNFLATADMGIDPGVLAAMAEVGLVPSYSEAEQKWTLSIDTNATMTAAIFATGIFGWVEAVGDPVFPDGRYDWYIEVRDLAGNKWGDMMAPTDLNHYVCYFDSTIVDVETDVGAFPTLELNVPPNVMALQEFHVIGIAANIGGIDYSNVRFNIILNGPATQPATRAEVFEITAVDGNPDTQGINDTFVKSGDSWVGYWGPSTGFPMPAEYGPIIVDFTIVMTDTTPAGAYTVTVELVDLNPDPVAVPLASAVRTFDLASILRISVSPGSLDFGRLLPGQSSSQKTITVTNEGTASVAVSASSESEFYQNNLTLNTAHLIEWGAQMPMGGSVSTEAVVTVPIGWSVGPQTGTIIFWAKAPR